SLAKPSSVDRELERANRTKCRHVFWGTADYPERLATIHAPPPVILVRGDVGLLGRGPLAIVGARKASAAGKTLARRFAEAFGEAGRAVVSGLARGVDGAAHEASLDTGTVAVVAGGVDRPTPEEHVALADEIVDRGGAVVSEMPLGLVPLARDYPRRNRLIAGLCDAVVVVEAAARSGSLHTARYAADENREVFALPGSPLDPRAAGCLELIRSGAQMAVTANDVLSALPGWSEAAPRLPGFAEDAPPPLAMADEDAVSCVAEQLSLAGVSVDALVRETGLRPSDVLAALVELELDGRAERDVDGSVRRGQNLPS
ncbi:MAG: DNA-processing protein DprA, partial [Pseudomonadota bacterium]